MVTTVAPPASLSPSASPPHGAQPCPDCQSLPDFGGYYVCHRRRVLLRRLSVSRGHLLRLPRPAIATDAYLWNRVRHRVDWYVTAARDEGWLRWLTTRDFEERAERLDRGWGVQMAVDLSRWRYQGQGAFPLDDNGLSGPSMAA